MTRNSDKQIPTKLLTAWCNNKWQFGGVLHSNKKNLVQNIALIVPIVDRYGSLKLLEKIALDYKYWKYLIHGIENTPEPQPVPPPSTTTERSHLPYPPYPPHPSKSPPTLPSPRQSTRPPPITSPWEAQSPASQTIKYYMEGVGQARRNLLGILLRIGRPTKREIKIQ